MEDALGKLQAAVSDDPHPLLQEGGSDSKDDTARLASIDGPSLSAEDEEFLDAFGMHHQYRVLMDIHMRYRNTHFGAAWRIPILWPDFPV